MDAGILFRALVADTGDGEKRPLVKRLREEGLPSVVSGQGHGGIWAPADAVHSPQEAVEELPWGGQRLQAKGSRSRGVFGTGTRSRGGQQKWGMGRLALSAPDGV